MESNIAYDIKHQQHQMTCFEFLYRVNDKYFNDNEIDVDANHVNVNINRTLSKIYSKQKNEYKKRI